MPQSGRAIRIHTTGDPVTTPVLEELEAADPEEGEVMVRIRFAPVHPADLNMITGTYGTKLELPAVPGSEGFGEIVAAGEGVPDRLQPSTPVILRDRAGSWREFVTVPASSVTPVPNGLDPRQAAMLKINPVTAWRLLHEPMVLNEGDWVAQNAANSAVGTCLIQVARELGLHTLNVVRSDAAADLCRSAGAEHVLIDGDELVAQALEQSGGERPKLACNAVGGPAAIRLMDLLAPGGKMVTYGAMSRQALKVPNSFLIFKDISLTGLWVTRWISSAPADEWQAVIDRLAAMMVSGALHIPVAETYTVENFKQSLEHASQDQRNGKVLLDFSE